VAIFLSPGILDHLGERVALFRRVKAVRASARLRQSLGLLVEAIREC
jgi:hypothetical protein